MVLTGRLVINCVYCSPMLPRVVAMKKKVLKVLEIMLYVLIFVIVFAIKAE
jgi:cytochrome b561